MGEIWRGEWTSTRRRGRHLQAGDCDSISRWLGAKHRKLEAGRRAGVSKWEVKTSKIGGFNSLHTPALTQVDQVMAVPGRVVGRTRVKSPSTESLEVILCKKRWRVERTQKSLTTPTSTTPYCGTSLTGKPGAGAPRGMKAGSG